VSQGFGEVALAPCRKVNSVALEPAVPQDFPVHMKLDR